MIEIKRKEKCTGCGLCKIKCPVKAINYEVDEEGFRYPVVNKEVCVNCGICEKVCIKNQSLERIGKLKIFAAKSKDKSIYDGSSSGGIFSEIAKYVLSKKGAVYGVAWSDATHLMHVCVESEDRLERLRKSKYVEASMGDDLFEDVLKKVNNGSLTLFSGTPCQVAAMKKHVGDRQNFLTVEVTCHGVPSVKIFQAFIDLMENKYKSRIANVNFRSKYRGWENFATEITFANGKRYRKINSIEQYYMRGFLTNMYLRPSCSDCQFKIDTSAADFILADYWRIDRKYNNFYDKNGVSLVVAKSEKALDILQEISERIDAISTEEEFAKNANKVLTCCNVANPNRKAFFEEFAANGYESAVKKYCKVGVLNVLMTELGLKPIIRKITGR